MKSLNIVLNMKYFGIFLIFSVFLFANIQSKSSTFSEYFQESLNDFVTNRLNDSKYCKTIFSPTVQTLKKSLYSTFVNSNSGTNDFDEKDRTDLCCRSLFKCDANKSIELNSKTEWNIHNCECVHSFQTCLRNLNTTLSNEIALIYNINKTKCYSKDYPIVQCIKFEEYSDSIDQSTKFINLTYREKYFKRCIKYELNQSRTQVLQIFDVPLNNHSISINIGGFLSSVKIQYMMTKLESLKGRDIFKTPAEITTEMFKLLNILQTFRCDAYEMFFEENLPKVNLGNDILTSAKKYKDEADLKFLLEVTKWMLQIACKNQEIINARMKSTVADSTAPNRIVGAFPLFLRK